MNVIEQIEYDDLSPEAQTVVAEEQNGLLFHISRDQEDEELFVRALNGEVLSVYRFDRDREVIEPIEDLSEGQRDDLLERYENSLCVVRDSSYESDTTRDWINFVGWVIACAGAFSAFVIAKRVFFGSESDDG